MKVSVIIPIYNSEAYLEQCVDSVLSQDFDEFEVILVDDGSTDASPSIVDKFAAQDNRIRPVHKKNGGLSSARNAGLEVAVGDYVIFLDSDDWWNSDTCLRQLYDVAVQNDADFVRGEYRRVDETGSKFLGSRNFPNEIYHNKVMSPLPFLERVVQTEYYAWLYLVRRSSLGNACFRESLKYQEDVDFMFRIMILSLKCVYLPLAFYNYRFRESSMIRLDSPVKLGYTFEIPFYIHSYSGLCGSEELRSLYLRRAIMAYKMAYIDNLSKSPFYEMRRQIVEDNDIRHKNKEVVGWIRKNGLLGRYRKLFHILLLPPTISLPLVHKWHELQRGRTSRP